MPDQVFFGKFSGGLSQYFQAFNIENDSFPFLFNYYVWRGQLKRKRGTSFLGQLTRQIQSVAVPNFGTQPWVFGPLTLVAGSGNLITNLWTTNLSSSYTLETSSTITPGSINLVGSVDGTTYTDPNKNGTLTATGGTGTGGTINYATGAITINAGGIENLTGTFSYYPGLPVMGLEDFVIANTFASYSYPVLLAFDTKYSYQILQNMVGGQPSKTFYDVNFYKNTGNPFTWNGQDYQLFWTTNYSGALWATNNVPGLHFLNVTKAAAIYTFTTSLGAPFQTLIVGDKLFFNEWQAGSTNNYAIGTISAIVNATLGQYNVTFTGGADAVVNSPGKAFMLTNSLPGIDGIRWYDGDPTGQTGIPNGSGLGWVNFNPPLSNAIVSINNLTPKTYYLAGALMVNPYKDRLLFFAPWIQAADGTPAIQLLDTILWSWNGTPYYTNDYITLGPPIVSSGTGLVPVNQTANYSAYFVDQTGKGGYLSAGIDQPLVTFGNHEDALLIGFGGSEGRKTRFVYTGNDLQPFLFFNINSQQPSSSTFSSVVLDEGTIDIGTYGICMTDQQQTNRIDIPIIQEVFQIQQANNGIQRVNAIRDYTNEWIYFSYPLDDSQWKFPTQTLMLNYRDKTWSILYENYTRHGRFRSQSTFTWATCPFPTWSAWREPWNSGLNEQLIPDYIAGNPQGYVLLLDQGTGEAQSGTIKAISLDSSGFTQITSINHCVTNINPTLGQPDYVYFQGSIGSTFLNGLVGKVINVIDANNFVVDILFQSGTYLGLGTFARLSQPLFQTKQYAPYWEQGRQVRIGIQKYLLTTTAASQVTANIYLSQDNNDPWNNPINNASPNGLIYSQVIYTCPESTNLGLTSANSNLQTQLVAVETGASPQQQMWHRYSVALQGDSFQIGITLSDSQMKNIVYATDEITLHGMQFTIYPSMHIC